MSIKALKQRKQLHILPVTALSMLTVLAVTAILGPTVFGEAASTTDTAAANQLPSTDNWLGTDALGRDIFARVLTASRLSLLLALGAVGIGFGVGVPMGAVTAVMPPKMAGWLSRTIETLVAFPPLLLSIVLAVIVGLGAHSAIIAIGVAYAPYFARLSRNLASQIASADFISASRMLRVSKRRLLSRHVLPNVGESLLLNGASALGSALLAFAALSFLGLGVQSPQYDWGRLLSVGLDSIYVNPTGALGPAAGLVFAGLAFNLSGEVLAKRLALRATLVDKVEQGTVSKHAVTELKATGDKDSVLHVKGLRIDLSTRGGTKRVVRGVDISINQGEIVGIVGESGSGKSISALSFTGLQPLAAKATFDELSVVGAPIASLPKTKQRHILANNVGYIFQDPISYLNPALKIKTQLSEGRVFHGNVAKTAAHAEAIELLGRVGINAPEVRMSQYPQELSGGMRQRAMIAMSLMNRPRLIIADEPTTALDVTVQSQVLSYLESIRKEEDVAILLISHDIGVVGQLCDRVLVMYAGKIVEELPIQQLYNAKHPYTRALLSATPSLSLDQDLPLRSIPGRPPANPGEVKGCAFADRCAFATEECAVDPPLEGVIGNRVACYHPQDEAKELLAAGGAE